MRAVSIVFFFRWRCFQGRHGAHGGFRQRQPRYKGQQSAPGLTTGSIEGDGLVFLGGVNLTLGTNNLSTTFSGRIQDGGINHRTGGSLAKTGTGTLTLSGANTYTGGTTVSAGTLLVSNKTGSGTGTGAVTVNAGTLGGSGIITGAVTIGTHQRRDCFSCPGRRNEAASDADRSKRTYLQCQVDLYLLLPSQG